jgi:pimeloyl-ACP methyl ester carboxylesterase
MEFTVSSRRAYAYTGGKALNTDLPCVVFIHGALHDHSVWNLLARGLAHHGYAVLALDQPGHGRSEGPPLDSVESLADWVLACLDAAGLSQAVVVGHSLGSLVALEVAARAVSRVKGLVMMATAFPMAVSDALLQSALKEPLRGIHLVNTLSHSTFAAKPSFPGPGAWLHGANEALMRRQYAINRDLNLFHHDFSVCNAYARGLAAAEAVECPSTFILGRRDVMTPPRAAETLGQALKARIEWIDAGHSLMTEAPHAVQHALLTALKAAP